MKNFRLLVAALAVLVAMGPSPSPAAGPLQFYSVTPCRLLDTRSNNQPLIHGAGRNFVVRGQCGIPTTPSPKVKGVALNAAVITPTASGHLTMWEYNMPVPNTSNVNFAGGDVIANGAIVALSDLDVYQISVYAALADAGSAHLVLDVVGYYQ